MAKPSSSSNRVSFSINTVIIFAVVFGAVGALFVWKTFAAKPNSGVTLSQSSDVNTFSVTATSKKMINEKYSLWGAKRCTDSSGTTMSAEYHAVRWPSSTNNTGTLSGFSTPTNASQCSVFVWLFPDAWTPVSNTVVYNP